jgi:hypothetical protein
MDGGYSMRRNKYNAKKTRVDGILFDSKHESEVYLQLKALRAAGKVKDFSLQPEFILQEGFRAWFNGNSRKWIQPIKYKADFRVILPDGTEEIWEAKGERTRDYVMRMKMLLKNYPGTRFREVH